MDYIIKVDNMKIINKLFLIILMINLTCWAKFFDHDRAVIDAGQGNWGQAMTKMNQCLVNNPDNPSIIYDAGVASYKLGQAKQAADYFKRVTSVVNAEPMLREHAYFNLGNAHVALKAYQDAVTAYKKALEIDPQDLRAQKNLEKAKELLRKQQEQQKKEEQQQKKQQDKKEEKKEQQQKSQDQQNNKQNSGKNQDNQSNNSDQNNEQKKENKQSNNNSKNPSSGNENNQKQDQQNGSGKPGQKNKQQSNPNSDNQNQQQNESGADQSQSEGPEKKQQATEDQQQEEKQEQQSQQQGAGEGQQKKQLPEKSQDGGNDTIEIKAGNQAVGQAKQDGQGKKIDKQLMAIMAEQEKIDARHSKGLIKGTVNKRLAGQDGQHCW